MTSLDVDPPANAVAAGMDMQLDSLANMYLTFDIDSEEYGVAISDVIEIVGMQRIMPIPDLPHYLKGVINLRGKVIPLMDVRLRFRMNERAYDDRTVIIVMEVDDALIGLIVDGVREVREIPDTQIDRHAQLGQSGTRQVIAGLGRLEDSVVVLLNPSVMVSEDEIRLLREHSEA
ncbi:MAG: chemotaxis protein CheW [Roseinatronobacter sp.]